MATFRIEAVESFVGGPWFAELYYPETAAVPIGTTSPIYPSMQAALDDALRILRDGFPDQPITPKPRTNP